MNMDDKETILDACLEEVVGGVSPPDLTAKIMQSLSEAASRAGNGQILPPPPSVVEQATHRAPTAPPVQGAPRVVRRERTSAAAKRRSRRNSNWLVVAAAASVIGVGVTIGLLALKLGSRGGDPSNVATTDESPDKANDSRLIADDQNKDAKDSSPRIKETDIARGAKDKSSDNVEDRVFGSERHQVASSKPVTPQYEPPQRPRPAPSPAADVIASINQELKNLWAAHEVQPAGTASDRELCERAYARIVGRQPTETELQQFVANSSPDKKVELVDRLLDSDEFAENWSSVWATALVGRSGGVRPGDLASREGLVQYLRDSFAADKPYDQIAFELVSATGSSRPDAEDFNGATNFMLANFDNNGVFATAHTARAFLGQRMQCAQCHDHYGDPALAQKSFWEVNSFLRQMDFQRDPESGNVQLVNVDFVGDGDDANDAIVIYENPAGEMVAAGPAFKGEQLPLSGWVSEVDRRTELAKRIIVSDEFSRAAVNRIWQQLLVYGFTKQVDDMGSSDPPSHPELLDRLATQFEAHDYDVKSVVRWIALSDAFALSSEMPDDHFADMPEVGDRPLFTRYYQRPVAPAEVYGSLVAATKVHASANINARVQWFNQFAPLGKSAGRGDPSLIVPVMPHVISEGHQKLLKRLAASQSLSLDQKIEHLFQASLSRKPRENELRQIHKLHDEAYEGDLETMFEVVWLVLLNSNEFAPERN